MSNPTSIAAANALSGEKTFATVQYPLSGDPQIDAISGCLAVIASASSAQKEVNDPNLYWPIFTTAQKISLCKFLLSRFTDELQQFEESQRVMREQRAAMTPFPTAPPPFIAGPVTYPGVNPYTTSAGSLQGLGSNSTMKDPANFAWGLDPNKQKLTFDQLKAEIIAASQPLDPPLDDFGR